MYLHSLLHQDNRYYTKYYYDAADKMLKAADTVHWETRTTTYNYDKNGNLIQMNMPFGAVMTYDYNVENRLTAIHDKEHLLMAALYDGNGDRIFTVTNKEDTSGWHDDGNNGQWSTLKPGGDYDDGTWHPDTSSADDGKWKPDVSSSTSSATSTSSNDGQWKPDVSSSSSSSSNDGQWRPEPGGNGEWNNDGQWRPDSNNNGQWKPDTTSSLTSSNSNAKVGEDMDSSRQTTSSYNDGQWRPDSNNNGQWNPSGNDGQWKPDATSSSTSSSNNGQWNPDSGNNGQWKPDVSSNTSSNTSSETTSSNVSSETSSDTTSSEVAKDENSGIPDVELAKGDWSNFAYDREMIRDTVLIPNGLNTWNEERYEMTGYINNINTANTQVLMEFHDKGYAGNIYEYAIGISNSYDKRESVSHWQNTNYYAYDGRGSVSDLVDGTGKVQMYHSYEPDDQTTLRFRGYIKNPYRYNAERVDYVPGIADFQYLRARYYAPNLGRFIQQDIVWGTIQTPLSQNLFIYVQNNPINFTDPSGKYLEEIEGLQKQVDKITTQMFDDFKEYHSKEKVSTSDKNSYYSDRYNHRKELEVIQKQMAIVRGEIDYNTAFGKNDLPYITARVDSALLNSVAIDCSEMVIEFYVDNLFESITRQFQFPSDYVNSHKNVYKGFYITESGTIKAFYQDIQAMPTVLSEIEFGIMTKQQWSEYLKGKDPYTWEYIEDAAISEVTSRTVELIAQKIVGKGLKIPFFSTALNVAEVISFVQDLRFGEYVNESISSYDDNNSITLVLNARTSFFQTPSQKTTWAACEELLFPDWGF